MIALRPKEPSVLRTDRSPGRPYRRLALLAVPLILAATGAALPASAGVARPGATTAATAVRDAKPGLTHGPTAVKLPGLHARAYTVTLITGDKVTLTRAASGQYLVTTATAPGPMPVITTTAEGNRNGLKSMYSIPLGVSALVSEGRVNKGLFDVPWLAAHGDTTSSAKLNVTIRYAGTHTAASLASTAGRLPGATVLATSPSAGTVTVGVLADQAARFWSALTTSSGATAKSAGMLAGDSLTSGIAGVWLAGHAAASPRPAVKPAGQPAYLLSVDVVNNADQGLAVPPSLIGVTGAGAGDEYAPYGTSCIDSTCNSVQFDFQVPAGIYSASAFDFYFDSADGNPQELKLLDPQISVPATTTATMNASSAKLLTVSTPRPSVQYQVAFGTERTLPDGTWYTDINTNGISGFSVWFTPTQPVTVGTFHAYENLLQGPAPVDMTVTSPGQLTLHPFYPWYTNNNGSESQSRFIGKQTVQLADGGYGTPADLANLNVRGKLVLLRVDNQDGHTCAVPTSVLNALQQDGAAGALFDPSKALPNGEFGDGLCTVPLLSEAWILGASPPALPFATIPAAEAQALRGLLTKSQVTVNVNGIGSASYIYSLDLAQEGRIPSTLDYAVGDRQLTAVNASFHAGNANENSSETLGAYRSNDFFTGGVIYGEVPLPQHFTQYFENSPNTIWVRNITNDADATEFTDTALFGGGSRTYELGAPPLVPGAVAPSDDVLQAQPGRFLATNGFNTVALCAFCRQGNTFWPTFNLVSGASDPSVSNPGPYIFAAANVHMYQNGLQIPQTTLLGVPVFQLPAQQGRYNLQAQGGNTTASWDFTSSAPAAIKLPPGTACFGTITGTSSAPCAPDPLVLLRYNAFTSLNNTVTAGTRHEMEADAYHQATTGAPAITGLKLWVSFDGGTTWTQVKVSGDGNGSYTGAYQVPAVSATNGYVSIKAQATDAGGNDVTETVLNAVAVATR